MSEITEILRRTPMVRGLTDEDLQAIASCCRERRFSAGSEIFAEASPGQALYVVCAGHVSLEMTIPTLPYPRTESLATATSGMIFGEIALIDHAPRSARARAVDEVTVLELPHDDLQELMEADPRIGYTILKNLATVLCARLRNTNLWLRNEWLTSIPRDQTARLRNASHRLLNELIWSQRR